MPELISVVVPVYNAAAYLDVCLQSLQAQTCPDWEAVLVDDGSTDASGALCDAWAERDSRMRVLHQQNAGVSAARNAGIEAARGSLLAFVDADDRLDAEYLQCLAATLGDADLAVCGVYGLAETDALRAETVSLDVLRCTPSRYTSLLYINYVFNKLYRAAVIRQHGIRFPAQMRRGEDAWFVQEYLLQCRAIAVTPRPLYWYQLREGSAMRRFYPDVCRDESLLMQRQYELFHPHGALPAAEEDAFQFWQHGKVLAILRYIITYAPGSAARQEQVRRMLADPFARQSIAQPPARVGLRGRLAAWLLRQELWTPLAWLLKFI